MRQLHPGNTALPMNEPHDSSQEFNVIGLPDAEVLRADAALGKNRRRFSEDESGPANCPAAKMHQVPVINISIRAGVLAHGRNKYAVGKCEIANCQGIEQMRHRFL